jgi:hypothetical protein
MAWKGVQNRTILARREGWKMVRIEKRCVPGRDKGRNPERGRGGQGEHSSPTVWEIGEVWGEKGGVVGITICRIDQSIL